MRKRLFTTAGPLFCVEGYKEVVEGDGEELLMFLFVSYELALHKGKELLHQHYQRVSVYRVDEVG